MREEARKPADNWGGELIGAEFFMIRLMRLKIIT